MSSFNLQARVEVRHEHEYMPSYRVNDPPKRATTYQVIASYPQANNYDHIPEKAVFADREA